MEAFSKHSKTWLKLNRHAEGQRDAMKRRHFLRSTIAGAAALAAPKIVRAEAQNTMTFVPHADLVSLDPVWTTADVTRNFSLAVYDTLYGYDAEFTAQPQMVDGHRIENGGLQGE